MVTHNKHLPNQCFPFLSHGTYFTLEESNGTPLKEMSQKDNVMKSSKAPLPPIS